MCLSYLQTCVLVREVGSGLLLACGSFADPGPILHPAVLPTLAHTCPTCRSGRQRAPASLPRSLPTPRDFNKVLPARCRFPTSFPCHGRASFPTFPTFPVSALPVPRHGCQTTVPDVPGLGAAPHRPGGERKAAGTLRDGTRLCWEAAEPSQAPVQEPTFPGLRCSPLRDVPEPRGRAQRQQAARSQGRAGGGEGMAGRGWHGRMDQRTGAFMRPLWGHLEPPSQWAPGRSQAPLPLSPPVSLLLPDEHCATAPSAPPGRETPSPALGTPRTLLRQSCFSRRGDREERLRDEKKMLCLVK